MTAERLYAEARATAARAHAPYSGLRVGAVIEAESGERYPGVNVETSSYRLATCAEQAALARAVTEGALGAGIGRLRRIALARSDGSAILPCGACRQALSDLAPEITVVHAVSGGIRERPLRELLPEPFTLSG